MAQAAATARAGRPNRRPANRKALIVRAAADLFRLRGFHNVRQEEIAAAVGISGPALYRHFSNKQDLLAHAVDSGFQAMEAAIRSDNLPDVLAAAAGVAAQRRDIGVLWQRETRNLSPGERQRARRRLVAMAGALAALIREGRQELSPADAELLGWAVAAVLASPSHHQVEAPPVRLAEVLRAACTAVAASGVVPRPPGPAPAARHEPPPSHRQPPTTRRELLVSAATQQFSQRGYHEVSLSDIAAAAGIAGPSIYKHFANKSDLLYAALTRGAEALRHELADAVGAGRDPEIALRALVESYVDFVLRHTDLVGTLVTEVINLPPEQQHVIRRVQHGYVDEWRSAAGAVRPELDGPATVLRVHAAFGVVNDVARIPFLRERADVAAVLTDIALTVLAC